MKPIHHAIIVYGLMILGVVLCLTMLVGCRTRNKPAEIKVAPKTEAKPQTQYIIQVDKNGQILSSKEYTEQAAKPLPDAEKVVYIDAINKEEAAKKAEDYVQRMMVFRKMDEQRQKEAQEKAKAKTGVTITITINR